MNCLSPLVSHYPRREVHMLMRGSGVDGVNVSLPFDKDDPSVDRAPWPHVDQSPNRRFKHCVQGIMNLVSLFSSTPTPMLMLLLFSFFIHRHTAPIPTHLSFPSPRLPTIHFTRSYPPPSLHLPPAPIPPSSPPFLPLTLLPAPTLLPGSTKTAPPTAVSWSSKTPSRSTTNSLKPTNTTPLPADGTGKIPTTSNPTISIGSLNEGVCGRRLRRDRGMLSFGIVGVCIMGRRPRGRCRGLLPVFYCRLGWG